MTRERTINIVLAIIGLLADIVGLGTFAAGLWGVSTNEGQPSYYSAFMVLYLFLLFYAWLTFAYFLAARKLKRLAQRREVEKKDVNDVTYRATWFTGGLLFPFAIIWWIVLISRAVYLFAFIILIVGGYALVGAGIVVLVNLLLHLLFDLDIPLLDDEQ